MSELERLQDRFQRSLLNPDSEPNLEWFVDGRFSAAEGLEVYRSGYRLRLLDCLRGEYPVTRKTLGVDMFDRLAQGFIVANPSRSTNLEDLGKGFADFLAATQPKVDAASSMLLRVPVDLARMERTTSEIWRGPGPEENATDGVAAREEPAYRATACLRLSVLSAPLIDYYHACRRGEDIPLPDPRETRIAMGRRNYRVTMAEVTTIQFELLAALTGSPWLEAIRETAATFDLEVPFLLGRLEFWLPVAVSHGWIEPARGVAP